MSGLSADNLDEVLATAQAAMGDVADSIERGLGIQAAVSCGKPAAISDGFELGQWAGPGLALVLMVQDDAVLVLIPDTGGGLPSWCANPDPTGKSKLNTLAQELGTLVLPERFMPTDFRAGYVSDLAAAVKSGQIAENGGMIPLEMHTNGGAIVPMALVWPLRRPGAVLVAPGTPRRGNRGSDLPSPARSRTAPHGTHVTSRTPGSRATFDNLPLYSRSLLKIQVPVAVTLAEKRQALRRIVELGPGAIIQFDKSCEEVLQLDVGGHTVAVGEAVKVGDKFGLRITAMVLPGERFEKAVP